MICPCAAGGGAPNAHGDRDQKKTCYSFFEILNDDKFLEIELLVV